MLPHNKFTQYIHHSMSDRPDRYLNCIQFYNPAELIEFNFRTKETNAACISQIIEILWYSSHNAGNKISLHRLSLLLHPFVMMTRANNLGKNVDFFTRDEFILSLIFKFLLHNAIYLVSVYNRKNNLYKSTQHELS